MGTNQDKLTYLKETKNQIKSILNTPYNVYRDYVTLIEKYIKNQPKSIVEGSTVTCENGIDLPCSIDVNGMSKQYTTEGYQLLDLEKYYYSESNSTLNGVTVKVENGILKMDGTNATATGTAKSRTVLKDSGINTILTPGTYYLGVNLNGYYEDDINTLVQFTIGTKTIEKNYILVQWYYPVGIGETAERPLIISNNTSKTTYEPYTGGYNSPNMNYPKNIELIKAYNNLQIDETNWKLTDNGIKSIGKAGVSTGVKLSAANINLKANTTYYLHFCLLSRPVNSVSFSTYIDDVENNDISFMSIEKKANFSIGKIVSRVYTPTKDETLKVLMWGNSNSEIFEFQYWVTIIPNTLYTPYGYIGLKQSGIQLLDYTTAYYLNTSVKPEFIDNGFVLKYTSEGYRIVSFKTDLKANTRYILKCDYEKISGNATEPNLYLSDLDQYLRVNQTFTPKADSKQIGIYLQQNQNDSVFNITNIRLYKEQYADKPCEPYIEPKMININLAGNSLAKIKNTSIIDLLKISLSGDINIKQQIKLYELTGDENIQISHVDDFTRFSMVVSDINYTDQDGRNTDIMCNYFTPYSGENRYYMCFRYKNQIFFYPDENITTLEQFKAWVKEKYESGNPVKILYKLAESKTIPLPSIEPIQLIKGVTNVFEPITNLDTTMKVEYIVDAESLQGEITELENAVIELGGTL